MGDKIKAKKTKMKRTKRVSRRHSKSTASLRMFYTFLILFSTLVLAGIALVMGIETPVVWTFLYGIGGWAALTNNLGRNLK
jgi:hypothetical protein